MKKSKVSLVMALMFVVVMTLNTVLAVSTSLIDNTQKGSLTIKALNEVNGQTEDPEPLKGVEYSLYRVDDIDGETVTTLAQAEEASKTITAVVKTTGENGIASFTNLTLGRYYAKVTSIPTGVSNTPESFIVDIPMTNDNGNGWNYNVEVSPKVSTALGNAVFTKVDEKRQPIQGVEFKVQVSTDKTTWTDYVPEGATEVKKLTTDVNGQVKLENYPITYNGKNAYFRVVELSVPDKTYIIDNKFLPYVNADAQGRTSVSHPREGDSETPADIGRVTLTNYKPQITKTVSEGLDVMSANATDTIPFNVTLSVPSIIGDMTTYKMIDTLPAGLTGRENLVVKGLKKSTNEEVVLTENVAYTKTEAGKALTLAFVPEQLTAYTTVVVTYNSKLDMDNAVIGSEGNTNSAKLVYTNNVDVDGSEVSTTEDDKVEVKDGAKVVTGGVKIYKVDADNNALQGAQFKIATTKANAEAGTFVRDEAGNDVVATSGTDGYTKIEGLAYNDDETAKDYWLVETQAPTYVENGETKSYSLLSSPVKVSVSGTSHTVNVEVVNKKPYNLPLTGGIGATLFIIVGVSLIVVGKSIKKEQM